MKTKEEAKMSIKNVRYSGSESVKLLTKSICYVIVSYSGVKWATKQLTYCTQLFTGEWINMPYSIGHVCHTLYNNIIM